MVLSKLVNIVSSHKKKFMFLGVIAGGVFAWKNNYFNMFFSSWEEKFIDKYSRQKNFQLIERAYLECIRSFHITLMKKVNSKFDADDMLDSYKNLKSKTEKFIFWQELAVISFSRIAAIIYAYTVFVITIQIHYCVVLGSTIKNNGNEPLKFTPEHFKFISNFIENKIDEFCNIIKDQMKVIISGKSVMRNIEFKHIDDIFYTFQSSMCFNEFNNPLKNMKYFFYNESNEIFNNPEFNIYLNEIYDVLDSDQVYSLATSCANFGFHLFSTELSMDQQFNQLNDGVSLVTILPKIYNLSNQTNVDSFEITFLEKLLTKDSVKLFSANMFESFST